MRIYSYCKIWIIILALNSFFISFNYLALAADIPSCISVVENMNKPGAAPNCAPAKMDNQQAFELIKITNIKKIGFDWYVMSSENDWKNKIDYKTKWQILALLVSAIQTLYEENADIYFIVTPQNKKELMLLEMGNYPMDKIIAHARYVMPDFDASNNFPAGHFKRIYTLIVY